METVLQVEIDKWATDVLARHWPETERVSDVRDVGIRCVQPIPELDGASAEAPIGGRQLLDGIDIVYGGSPCQDVSVAGKRAGLGGERSGLWFEFERIVRELRPRWAVIENVPGLLSSNGGDDFAVILGSLDELGFDAAWAILDAQHFGVPQRRRRVFIVAGPRGRGPEKVLSLCESCGGNPETGGTPGQDVAHALRASSGSRGTDDPDRLTYIANDYTNGGFAADYIPIAPELAYALAARNAKGVSMLESQDTFITPGAGVRRLTPRECERLQGFPDDWTRYTAAGKEIADSHRYRMTGNAVAVPVAEWVAHRLMAVDGSLTSSTN